MTERPSIMIRPARPEDVPAVVEMVHELAEYERAPELCHVTEEHLREALFRERPAVFCHVAVTVTDEPIGFALWFLNFSTWEGVHGIYLEDLYVRPAARGTGAGKALLATLARICVERGYARLDWWVLRWNVIATDFYKVVGAVPMDEWVPYRLSGVPLQRLAAGTPTSGPPTASTETSGPPTSSPTTARPTKSALTA